MKVVLLGTGVPLPNPDRFGTSLVVRLEREALLFDCGFGATIQFFRANLDPCAVTHLFLTHLHYDHTVDYAHFALATWRLGRSHPLRVFGPAGTFAFSRALLDGAYGADRQWRRSVHKRNTLPDVTVEVAEYAEGPVAQGDGWRVTALRVDHPPVPLAFAFRLEAQGNAVVFSGDTRYFPPLADFSRDADLLIHEVMTPRSYSRAHEGHTAPEDVGRIAAAAGVRRLVLTHLLADEDMEDLTHQVRKHYSGPVDVGCDLMGIDIP